LRPGFDPTYLLGALLDTKTVSLSIEMQRSLSSETAGMILWPGRLDLTLDSLLQPTREVQAVENQNANISELGNVIDAYVLLMKGKDIKSPHVSGKPSWEPLDPSITT
jgi:hypothetical protein